MSDRLPQYAPGGRELVEQFTADIERLVQILDECGKDSRIRTNPAYVERAHIRMYRELTTLLGRVNGPLSEQLRRRAEARSRANVDDCLATLDERLRAVDEYLAHLDTRLRTVEDCMILETDGERTRFHRTN